MRVQLKVSRGGTGFQQYPGEVIEVGADEAARMIEAGQCVVETKAGFVETSPPVDETKPPVKPTKGKK